MIYQAIVVLVALAVSQAHPSNYGGGGPVYASGPIPYNFNYAVNDAYTGNNFGQSEKSDGNNVWGSYTVALPDGRKQQVDYTADHGRGFVAKVSYSGKAQHPTVYGPAITFPQNGGGYH
ncbi:cuticle protein 19-like [Penaeus japonicus]|uniref:cuticle protein 19-like n=1 Tax=Penaeus japonicus TaxID=27405 RepID=UPI001C710191|nr:cuticle protein 19-like [Penaeus japonicus]XP_042886915.1 cuticle protein 19-like [Penaeus japonicus]